MTTWPEPAELDCDTCGTTTEHQPAGPVTPRDPEVGMICQKCGTHHPTGPDTDDQERDY